MAAQTSVVLSELVPARVETVLSQFLSAAREAYGAELLSIILYGSAAEGKLSPSSDVNLLLVLRSLPAAGHTRLVQIFSAAEAAIRLRPMFLLENEVAQAATLFAQKFADIGRRHRVLFGADLFASVRIDREAKIFRLKQVLLNLRLRLREAYVTRAGKQELFARFLADAVGPLRASAGTLAELRGIESREGSAALQALAAELGAEHSRTVADLFAIHERHPLSRPNHEVLFATLALLGEMLKQASELT